MVVVRQQHAHKSQVARPGNVNNVRPELAQHARHQRQMPEKSCIKPQVFLQLKGKRPTRKFQRSQLAFRQQSRQAASRAYTQKRQIAPASESLKVATGVGHTVDFVERIRKVRHAHTLRSVYAQASSYSSKSRL